jgi:hypothetical protein
MQLVLILHLITEGFGPDAHCRQQCLPSRGHGAREYAVVSPWSVGMMGYDGLLHISVMVCVVVLAFQCVAKARLMAGDRTFACPELMHS